jgi:outer membrane immunogenic protein
MFRPMRASRLRGRCAGHPRGVAGPPQMWPIWWRRRDGPLRTTTSTVIPFSTLDQGARRPPDRRSRPKSIRRLIATTAIAGLTATASIAQDAKGASAAPTVLPAPTYWGGWFVGAQIGGAQFQSNWDFRNDGRVSDSSTGFIGGLYGGANFQDDRFVYGFDAYYNAANTSVDQDCPNTAFSCSADVSYTAAIRGRVGTIVDAWHLYGAAGVAFSKASYEATRKNGDPVDGNYGSGNYVGWTIAAGAERKFAENWSARFEIGYADYGSETLSNNEPVRNTEFELRSTTLTIGITRHF